MLWNSKKKTMRKFVIFLVLIVLLIANPTINAASSGKCGENITWTLDDEGNLIIEGMGKMDIFYTQENVPWGQEIKTVKISEGILTLGMCAFQDCQDLKSVVIPNSVRDIGYAAFRGCTGLKSVIIGNSVVNIEDSAFQKCSSLLSVEFPNSVKRIGYFAFSGCSGLKNVNLPNSVLVMDGGAFSFCTELTSIKISNSVTEIGYETFRGCKSLKSVEIPENVTKIGTGAFSLCSALTNVVIGKNVSEIGNLAFQNCAALNKVISYAIEPPACEQYDPFDGDDKGKCVLEVPDESVEKYKMADVWKEFLNISGVESVAADGNVSVAIENGMLTVRGASENADMEIYSITGATIYRGKVTAVEVSDTEIYIVRVAGKVFKVVK